MQLEEKLIEKCSSSIKEDVFSSFRKRALNRFIALGLPTKKTEGFQYVPLQQLFSDYLELKFGKAALSHSEVPKSVIVLPLEKAIASYNIIFQNRFNQTISQEQSPFVFLNHLFHEEGLFLYIPPMVQVSEPIFLYSQPGDALHPKLQIFIGKGAKADFVFESKAEMLSNAYIDFILEDEARATCTISDGSERWHFDTIRAHLKRNSALTVFSYQRGCKTSRQDIQVTLAEEGSEAILKGCWFAQGENQCHNLISVQHLAPHTRSQQHYKGVLADKSKSSFEGRIFVGDKAQYTEAYQLNHNLIVGQKAVAYSKPNLKIFTDDVKASHGCTISDISEEELFYLKTRGVDEALCRELLVKGFLKEILNLIPYGHKI